MFVRPFCVSAVTLTLQMDYISLPLMCLQFPALGETVTCFVVFQTVHASDEAQLGTSSDITACRRHLNRHMSPDVCGVCSNGRGGVYESASQGTIWRRVGWPNMVNQSAVFLHQADFNQTDMLKRGWQHHLNIIREELIRGFSLSHLYFYDIHVINRNPRPHPPTNKRDRGTAE